MCPLAKLLCVLALTLLPVDEASPSGGDPSPPNRSYDLSGSALTDLFNQPVHQAERMSRPWIGPIPHSGVRLTLEDGSQWLVHKGSKYGDASDTVVVDSRHMSPSWKPFATRDFEGTKTVSDFVGVGGTNYNLMTDNCHHASGRMMDQ